MFLIGEGTYDINYRVYCACRNGTIQIISKDKVETTIKIDSKPICLTRMEKSIIVSSIDNAVSSYTLKGKKLWSITMP